MGSTECTSNDQIKKIFIKEINELNNSIVDYIQSTFLKKKFTDTNILNSWKNDVLKYIDSAFYKKNKEIEEIIENISLKKVNINKNIKKEQQNNDNIQFKSKDVIIKGNNELKFDFFTPKDIQNKNLDITRDFENYYSNFINDCDEEENETIAIFLKHIANLSRISYNESIKFLDFLYKEYEDSKKNKVKDKIIIFTLEQFKKQFSSWVKNNNNIESIVNKYLNKLDLSYITKIENKEMRQYFLILFKELLILYYQCHLSFPSIDINFKNENNCYNAKKMIDILNNGNDRKVNFIFFPSLYSNGNFLQNGKQWVFTYIKNSKKHTFYFDKIELIPLLEITSKSILSKLSNKLKLEVKIRNYLVAELNYDILDTLKQEYVFHLKNKKTKKIEKYVKNERKFQLDENFEFIECEFFLMDEKILSTNLLTS